VIFVNKDLNIGRLQVLGRKGDELAVMSHLRRMRRPLHSRNVVMAQ